MEVDTATAQAQGLTVDHQGKTYYFCSTGDKQLFEKDPDRYIAKPQAAEAAPPAPEVHPATMPPQPAKAAQQEAALPAKCPVCGMDVDTATAQAQGLTVDYQGTTYYFCSTGDKQLFEKDPGSYTAKPRLTEAAPPAPDLQAARRARRLNRAMGR
jgi:Cu+-exporting ATPase